MVMRVRDIMQKDLQTIPPETSIREFELRLIERRVGGFPVEEDGKLVGIATRSDIVRTLNVERTYEGQLSDYYNAISPVHEADVAESVAQIGARIGARIEDMTVRDVMCKNVLTANPDQTLDEIARLMVDHGVHRLPVTENARLLGIVTTLDLMRLIADGRLEERKRERPAEVCVDEREELPEDEAAGRSANLPRGTHVLLMCIAALGVLLAAIWRCG
jgi:CBS domain-containing protein